MRKSYLLMLLAASSVLLFSGCSSVKETISENIQRQIIDESEIESNSDYLKYQYHKTNGLLTEEGLPVEAVSEINSISTKPATPTGSVHVTFARNPYIAVYYSDQQNNDTLLDANCYMNPGDTIYCRKPQASTENSNYYFFQEFRIYTYDANGKRSNDYTVSTAEDGIVYKIPENFSKEGISVVPIGRFEDRIITLHDYYIDKYGKNKELSGEWYVNNKKEPGDVTKVDSTDEVEIAYFFDTSKYYMDHTVPDYLHGPNGEVKFRILDVLDEVSEYDVYLRSYMTANLKGDPKKGIKTIKINGDEVKFDKNKLTGLKIGDRIEITTNGNYTANCLKFELESSVNNQFVYRIPEINDESADINISNNTKAFENHEISNGTLNVSYSGINDNAPIKNGENVSADTKVTVLILPNDGYYLTGKEIKDNKYQKTMKYSEYLKNINSIINNHAIKKYISVTFDDTDPDQCGTVKYTLKNKQINGLVTNLQEGQEVKLTYEIDKKANYVINRDSGNIFNTVTNTFSSKKEEVNLKITPDLDDKTITRDQYIKVKEAK